MKLTTQNVREMFEDCSFKEHNNPELLWTIEGVKLKANLHINMLSLKRSEIESMLSELPDSFKSSIGGGWSFLNMCITNNEEQWCDLHETMDQLFCLGYGIGKLRFLVPREMWDVLPGGVPYIVID
ncbi:hypothetical protein MUK70_11675 [Dyadobacter chenwenxiniae]|uniref:Uncharacterized protein n=1 Tax=Dyadobacter chenwenxiniae TaxID=2906456 RepID=A0A9X1PGQ1_9BACT|nr:hypothetical protein [Dyadobacter chenwenxiniae]MCF0059900.1 hypothetical protein [Dyadobacter chenwenxiniae]UON85639.1 hypothetical protein MUK70_11675 [Dyadobacter chenwenxiniae]